ncbi:MAG: LacI family DNA-binding transcriptional regulator [Deinococcota bacterium]
MTLGEIAQKLNLSTATVSRALSRPDLVAEETRERVLTAVKAYGYTPNAIARSLKQGSTNTLGVIVSDIQNPFYATVVRAIEQFASQHGYSCIVCNADEDPQKEEQAFGLLSELQVSGVIHASTGMSLDVLERRQREGFIIIDIDRYSGLKNVDAVTVDNVLGASLAGQHLLELGHKQIAVITGPLHLSTGFERLKGFENALEQAGVDLPSRYIQVGTFRESSGYEAALALLDLREPPTALFTANNEMMAGALAAIRERELKIPDDISLISFDDVRWARYIESPLTVVAQPAEDLGVTAARLFFERLQGRSEVVREVLLPHLIVRDSCTEPRLATAR